MLHFGRGSFRAQNNLNVAVQRSGLIKTTADACLPQFARRVLNRSPKKLPIQGGRRGSGRGVPRTRSLYDQTRAVYGIESLETLINAHNLAYSLLRTGHVAETKPFLRKNITRARRSLGDEHDTTLDLRFLYAKTLLRANCTSAEMREAVTILVEIDTTSRRVFGSDHPQTVRYDEVLESARRIVAAREEEGK